MRTFSRLALCSLATLWLTTAAAWPQEPTGGLSHVVCENCHTEAPAPAHDNCVGCHGQTYGTAPGLRTAPRNVVAELQKPSHHPLDAGDPNSSCHGCHDTSGIADPNEVVYPRLLRSSDPLGAESYFGNQFCYNCHEHGADLPGMELARFSESAHDDARLEPESGTGIRCRTCHEPHGADAPDLTRAREEALCYAADGACHSAAQNSARGIAIRDRFAATPDTFAHHNMTSEDQVLVSQVVERDPIASRKWPIVTPSKLECSDCHNAHLNDSEARTIDSYDRSIIDTRLAIDALTITNEALGASTDFGPKLTDGQVRGVPVYLDAANQGETVNMVVDLGSVQSVDKMVAYVGPEEGPNASSVAFAASVDGVVYESMGTLRYSGYDPTAFALKFAHTSARYLRYAIYRPYIEPGEEQWSINKYWVSELEAYDTGIGVAVRDVNGNCLGCHTGTVPNGVSLSEKTRYWKATANSTDRILTGVRRLSWDNEFHGGKSGIGGVVNSSDTLKPPYRRSMEPLACTTCHDEHGSSNVFHLRETVNGQTGIRVTSFRGKDAAGFCRACHNVNLLGPNHCYGCHTTATGCFDCHYHGQAVMAHGESGGL